MGALQFYGTMTPREADYVIRMLHSREGLITHVRCSDGEVRRVINVDNCRDKGDDFDHLQINVRPFAEGWEQDFIFVNDIVEITDEEGSLLYKASGV